MECGCRMGGGCDLYSEPQRSQDEVKRMFIIEEEIDFSIFKNDHISEMEIKELQENNIDINDVIMTEEIVVPPIDDPNVAIKLLTNYSTTPKFWQTLDKMDDKLKTYAHRMFIALLYNKFNCPTYRDAETAVMMTLNLLEVNIEMFESISPTSFKEEEGKDKESIIEYSRNFEKFCKSYYIQKLFVSRLPSFKQFMTYKIPATGEYFYYVPIKGILIDHLLKDENVIQLIENETPETVTKYVRDNGLVNHIRIMLYGDDLSLAVRGSEKCHKLCAIFMDIENGPQYSWNSIPLVMLFPREKVNEQLTNLDVFLQPLIDELKELKNGLQLRNGKTFKVSLAYATGDDLFINQVLGLKDQSSDGFINIFPIAPFDIFHNFCEGILVMLAENFLADLEDDIYYRIPLNYDTIRMSNGLLEIVRSSSYDKTTVKITGKGVSKFEFFVRLVELLPDQLLEKIESASEDNPVWVQDYLALRKVIYLAFSNGPFSQEEIAMIANLTNQIEKSLARFETLRKPEVHSALHLADVIEYYGSLNPCSSARFEHKHYYLKHLMELSKNFINCPKSIIWLHQLHQCVKMEKLGALEKLAPKPQLSSFEFCVEKGYDDETLEKIYLPPFSTVILREIKNMPGHYVEAKKIKYNSELKGYTIKGVLWKADCGRVEIIGKIRPISTDFSINDDQLSPHDSFWFYHKGIVYVNHAIKT